VGAYKALVQRIARSFLTKNTNSNFFVRCTFPVSWKLGVGALEALERFSRASMVLLPRVEYVDHTHVEVSSLKIFCFPFFCSQIPITLGITSIKSFLTADSIPHPHLCPPLFSLSEAPHRGGLRNSTFCATKLIDIATFRTALVWLEGSVP
jgi:hypothetical protein